MHNHSYPQERRLWPRISWNFIIKFKRQVGKDSEWEVSAIKNISKGGCFCFSQIVFQEGEVLDIEIQFPTLKEPIKFQGEVKRCAPVKDSSLMVFALALRFTQIDIEAKNIFNQTMDFFLKKQSSAR